MKIDQQVEAGLDFILDHFTAFDFPRTISTKTTEKKQIEVNNKAEALARFKQANYLDCRINAYSKHDIVGDPNFIFAEIDTDDQKVITEILEGRLHYMKAHPTVIFTGRGYHIYLPIETISIKGYKEFSSCDDPNIEFLRFAEKYISHDNSDPNHHPSFKSCMVRVPGSINSKTNSQVEIIQSWDGNRPHIRMFIGSFYAWLLANEKKQKENMMKYSNIDTNHGTQTQIKWIENILKTGLDDYRKTTVNLILAPYFVNIRKLPLEEAANIIQTWLELCRKERPLDFNSRELVKTALISVKKSGYKPLRLNTVKEKGMIQILRDRSGLR